MFGGKKAEVTSIIGEGTEFEGNLRLKGGIMVRIDGIIRGDVFGQARVIVGKTGKILGNVKVDHLAVYGGIKGNVEVKELELYSPSSLEGDIVVQSLYVEKGAVFNGVCHMKGGVEPLPQASPPETERADTSNPREMERKAPSGG